MLNDPNDFTHSDAPRAYDGVYVGVVTNNKDPENWGRVKVLYPWMHSQVESNWARLATYYAGKDRGSYFVPEVNDEVLLVFEHGDFNQPIVVGSLWNGKDTLPEPGHPDGKDNHKVFESRAGHTLTFDDTDGAERIALIDSSLQNRMIIDVAGDSITIMAVTGDIHIKAPAGSVNFDSKTMAVQVKTTKSHTSGATHDITVSKADYTETVGSGKSLSVGSTMSRTAPQVSVSASSSMSVTGGSTTMKSNSGGAMIQKGPVTQTIGTSTTECEKILDSSAVKTWTIGSAMIKSDGIASIDGSVTTLMAGMINAEAKSGQFSLCGSPIIHLGGLINIKADQVAFKPGG